MMNFIGGIFKTALSIGVIYVAFDFGKFEATKTLIEAAEESGGSITFDSNGKKITVSVE